MSIPFPEPTLPAASRTAVLLGYLDYFRSVLRGKLAGLDEAALRGSVLPSGWSPLELVKHLTFVEMRWLDWGFEGRAGRRPVGRPAGRPLARRAGGDPRGAARGARPPGRR